VSDSQDALAMRDNALSSECGLLVRCMECGKEYRKTRDWSAYCSPECRWENWKQTHVRLHRADLFAAFGKDWPAKIAAARDKRKGAA